MELESSDFFGTNTDWSAWDYGHIGIDTGSFSTGDDFNWQQSLLASLLDLGGQLASDWISSRDTSDSRKPWDEQQAEQSAQRQDERDYRLQNECVEVLDSIPELEANLWSQSSYAERIQALNTAAGVLAERVKINLDFQIQSLEPGNLGQCAPIGDGYEISLSIEEVLKAHPRDAVRTLMHEIRHAHQHELVELGDMTEMNPSEVDITTIARWKEEFQVYSTQPHVYKNLGMEADAELFAVKV